MYKTYMSNEVTHSKITKDQLYRLLTQKQIHYENLFISQHAPKEHNMAERFLGRDNADSTAYLIICADSEGGSDDKSARQTTFGKKSISWFSA